MIRFFGAGRREREKRKKEKNQHFDNFGTILVLTSTFSSDFLLFTKRAKSKVEGEKKRVSKPRLAYR